MNSIETYSSITTLIEKLINQACNLQRSSSYNGNRKSTDEKVIRMKFRVFFVVLSVAISSLLTAQATDWAKVHELTVHGIDKLYNLEMDDAVKNFDEVIRLAPQDPRGYFFKSMVHYYIFFLNRDKKEFEQFFALSEKIIALCEDALDRNENDYQSKFYLGGIYGFRGFAHQINGSYLKAAWDGKKGYAYLEEVATTNPDIYDAHMGFGLFRYFVAKVPKSFRWLLNVIGFSGDLEGGLASLKLAAEKGLYTKTEATFYLAQFLMAEGRTDENICGCSSNVTRIIRCS